MYADCWNVKSITDNFISHFFIEIDSSFPRIKPNEGTVLFFYTDFCFANKAFPISFFLEFVQNCHSPELKLPNLRK